MISITVSLMLVTYVQYTWDSTHKNYYYTAGSHVLWMAAEPGDVQQDQHALVLLHLWLVKFPWVVELVMWVGASQLEGVQLSLSTGCTRMHCTNSNPRLSTTIATPVSSRAIVSDQETTTAARSWKACVLIRTWLTLLTHFCPPCPTSTAALSFGVITAHFQERSTRE